MSNQAIDLENLRNLLGSILGDISNDHGLPRKTIDELQQAIHLVNRIGNRMGATTEESLPAAYERLAALYKISQSLGTSLELQVVLNQVMDAVIELTRAERGLLLLYDEDSDTINAVAARNYQGETLESAEKEISQTVIRTVLNSGEGLITTNAQDDPRFSGRVSVVMFAIRSVLVAPLRVRGKSIGVIYVDNRARTGNFVDEDLRLLTTFAVQAAIAIENARLFTQTDQNLAARVNELETLTRINQELNAHLDMQSILDMAQYWAQEVTHATRAWIALTNKETSQLCIATGPDTGKQLDPVPTVVSQALADGMLKITPAADAAPAQIAAPLRVADETFGVLVVEKTSDFTYSEESMLAPVSIRAASAIQNARLFDDVQQANLAKAKFVSNVSHELRLPMTSIKGFTDLILQGMAGQISDQQREFLNIIRNNVTRMTALVSDLSDINRIESGRLHLEFSSVSIATQVNEVITSLGPRLQDRQQTILIEIPDTLPLAHADTNRVTQVLNNLVSNAHKYTPLGGQIRISASQNQEKMIRVKIEDSGIGISEADQPKIFSQFFRSEDNAVRDQQGWGLGLNVARHLVHLMGGEIGFESTLGKGSTFWFTLPVVE